VPFATWLPVEPGGDVWDLVPGAAGALRTLYTSLWDAGVDAAVLDACRARVEAVVGGVSCPEPEDGGATMRAAVAFAEQYALDPHGVTDADAAALHGLFTPEQLAALTTALATFDALARVRVVLSSPAGTVASIDIDIDPA
jgi:hypothetical protein